MARAVVLVVARLPTAPAQPGAVATAARLPFAASGLAAFPVALAVLGGRAVALVALGGPPPRHPWLPVGLSCPPVTPLGVWPPVVLA